jgi:mycofactocin precursor
LTGKGPTSAGGRIFGNTKEAGMLSENVEVTDVETPADDEVDELLVEEVSIDGMCGVY